MNPTELPARPSRSSSQTGCILFVSVLALVAVIEIVLLVRWILRPENGARAVGIVRTWTKSDEEIVDRNDPRGVVTRNTKNGDITIFGGRIEDVPKWIPMMPGTRIERHFSITQQAQSPERDSLIDGRLDLPHPPASAPSIYDFYKKELVRQGFEIDHNPPPYLSATTSSRFVLVAVRKRGIHIQYTEWFETPPSGTR